MTPAASDADRSLAYGYDSVFCIFLVGLAILGRESPGWDSPRLLYWLALLLSLNLGAGVALRRRPEVRALSAAAILANCGVISAVVHESGGLGSRLWVLYLLPVFTAAMFMAGRELLLVAGGAVAFNAAFFLAVDARPPAAVAVDVGLRTGILALAAFFAWRGAERERAARARLARQREELDELLDKAGRAEPREESTRRLAEVGLMTAGVLHDLKAPLTVILGFAEVGAHAGDESARRDFERIRRAGLLCRDIVSSVLAAAGGASPAFGPCDVRDVLSDTLRMCVSVFVRRGVALGVALPEDPIRVQGDAARLGRLFLNLFTNAAQALQRGGRLEVAAHVDEAAGRVEITVADDGPGLPAELAGSLFKPFSTTRGSSGGTGLGLYLCREIALSHGGGIRAENRPAGGAAFTVTLPLAPEAAAAAQARDPG